MPHEALAEQFNANTPMGRPGTVEDIAAAALFLASPASAWVTGECLTVDGGMSLSGRMWEPGARVQRPRKTEA